MVKEEEKEGKSKGEEAEKAEEEEGGGEGKENKGSWRLPSAEGGPGAGLSTLQAVSNPTIPWGRN